MNPTTRPTNGQARRRARRDSRAALDAAVADAAARRLPPPPPTNELSADDIAASFGPLFDGRFGEQVEQDPATAGAGTVAAQAETAEQLATDAAPEPAAATTGDECEQHLGDTDDSTSAEEIPFGESAAAAEQLTGGISLTADPAGNSSDAVVTVFAAGEPEIQTRINIASETAREQIIATICEQFPDANQAEVSRTLLRLAVDCSSRRANRKRGGDGGDSQATQLVKLADNVELFRSPDDEAYARFLAGPEEQQHHEVSRVSHRRFKRWLSQSYYRFYGRAPSSQALQEALDVVAGKAVHEGEQRAVHVRCAEHAGRYYLDLVNDAWRAIEIDATGWRIVADPPVMFRRSSAMWPLPTPDPQGDIAELRQLVNVDDDGWTLLESWLVAAVRPTGPYTLLVAQAEHGGAKSTLCNFSRQLIDPNKSDLRGVPREPRDLMVTAGSGWVVGIDNMSYIPPWLSDTLCQLATGGGFATRTLYEDDEETVFSACRPIIINMIEELVVRSDLLDRSLLLTLPPISDRCRRSETEMKAAFAEAHPRLLGGLLTAAAAAMANEPSVQLDSLPRMADFARWATAAEPALGLPAGEVMRAYGRNRAEGHILALETSPVGTMLLRLVSRQSTWRGTATMLVDALTQMLPGRAPEHWPGTARKMGNALRRLGPNLRAAGVQVDFGKVAGGNRDRIITLTDTRRRRDSEGAPEVAAMKRPKRPGRPESAKSPGKTAARGGTMEGRSGTTSATGPGRSGTT